MGANSLSVRVHLTVGSRLRVILTKDPTEPVVPTVPWLPCCPLEGGEYGENVDGCTSCLHKLLTQQQQCPSITYLGPWVTRWSLITYFTLQKVIISLNKLHCRTENIMTSYQGRVYSSSQAGASGRSIVTVEPRYLELGYLEHPAICFSLPLAQISPGYLELYCGRKMVKIGQ